MAHSGLRYYDTFMPVDLRPSRSSKALSTLPRPRSRIRGSLVSARELCRQSAPRTCLSHPHRPFIRHRHSATTGHAQMDEVLRDGPVRRKKGCRAISETIPSNDIKNVAVRRQEHLRPHRQLSTLCTFIAIGNSIGKKHNKSFSVRPMPDRPARPNKKQLKIRKKGKKDALNLPFQDDPLLQFRIVGYGNGHRIVQDYALLPLPIFALVHHTRQ